MKKIILTIIIFILSFFITLLGTYIVLSIGGLYKINFINQYSFMQIFGLIMIIKMIIYRYAKTDSEEDYENALKSSYVSFISTLLVYLLSWVIAFLYYYIIN